MNKSKVICGLSALAVLCAVGVLEWHEQSRLNAGFRELDLAREKFAAQERRHLEPPPGPRSSQVNAPLTDAIAKAAGARARTPSPGSGASRAANAKAQSERAMLLQRYGLFFRERGLSPEQIDGFIALLNQQAEARADLQEAVRKEGLSVGPDVEAIRSELYRPVTEGLHALLGEDGYAAYLEYEKTSYYQMVWVQPLQRNFLAANVPIDDAQTEQLSQIFEANDKPVHISPTDLGSESAIDWESAVAQAANILTPAQMSVLLDRVQQLKLKQDQNIARLKSARATSATP